MGKDEGIREAASKEEGDLRESRDRDLWFPGSTPTLPPGLALGGSLVSEGLSAWWVYLGGADF